MSFGLGRDCMARRPRWARNALYPAVICSWGCVCVAFEGLLQADCFNVTNLTSPLQLPHQPQNTSTPSPTQLTPPPTSCSVTLDEVLWQASHIRRKANKQASVCILEDGKELRAMATLCCDTNSYFILVFVSYCFWPLGPDCLRRENLGLLECLRRMEGEMGERRDSERYFQS